MLLLRVMIWLLFTVAQLFKLVYKAAMAAGSELHPFRTVQGYFDAKPLTCIFRLILGQLMYFIILSNQHLLGGFLFGGSTMQGLRIGPVVLALICGLASDSLADIIQVAGAWILKKVNAFFS